MFGYIKPFKPELRICDFDAYKAVYCGLCGQLGKSYGAAARLTLSYDFTFLSMLHFAVGNDKPGIFQERCFVNPLKKVPVCRQADALVFSADVAAIMLYYKLLDNIEDDGPAAKIGMGALRPIAAAARKKAAAARPGCDDAIARSMQNQRELEMRRCDSVDEASHPTAKALEKICTQLSDSPEIQRVLGRMGYFVGRYVYLCDALDDLEKDIKKGKYNPYALRYGLEHGAGAEQRQAVYEKARESLYATIAEAAKAYDLLEPQAFKPVLDNVMFRGMRYSVDEILSKKEKIQ